MSRRRQTARQELAAMLIAFGCALIALVGAAAVWDVLWRMIVAP